MHNKILQCVVVLSMYDSEETLLLVKQKQEIKNVHPRMNYQGLDYLTCFHFQELTVIMWKVFLHPQKHSWPFQQNKMQILIQTKTCATLMLSWHFSLLFTRDLSQYIFLRTCMKTECVISGTTGGIMDPNYCCKISWSLTRLIIKLAGQTYKSTFFQLQMTYLLII